MKSVSGRRVVLQNDSCNFPKVRFDKGAVYPKHGHPDGEEILVLEGSWHDANGIHPKVRGVNAVNAYGFTLFIPFNLSADASLHSTTRELTC